MSDFEKYAEILYINESAGLVDEAIAELTGTSVTPEGSPKASYPDVFTYKVVEFARGEDKDSLSVDKIPGDDAKALVDSGWTSASFHAEQLSVTPRDIARYAEISGQTKEEARSELGEYCGMSTVLNLAKPALVIKPAFETDELDEDELAVISETANSVVRDDELGQQENGWISGPALMAQMRSDSPNKLSVALHDLGTNEIVYWVNRFEQSGDVHFLNSGVISNDERIAMGRLNYRLSKAAGLLLPSAVELEHA